VISMLEPFSQATGDSGFYVTLVEAVRALMELLAAVARG
jgi:hypothetical protein